MEQYMLVLFSVCGKEQKVVVHQPLITIKIYFSVMASFEACLEILPGSQYVPQGGLNSSSTPVTVRI